MTGKKIAWATIAVSAGVVILVLLLIRANRLRSITEAQAIPIEGAVIRRDADTKKELPIADVAITATDGIRTATTQSDAAGYFKLVLQKGVLSDRPVTVTFRHPDYQPLDLTVQTGRLAIPETALCCGHGSYPCPERRFLQPAVHRGLEYPGEIYHQHPDGDECGQRGQDLPGGQ